MRSNKRGVTESQTAKPKPFDLDKARRLRQQKDARTLPVNRQQAKQDSASWSQLSPSPLLSTFPLTKEPPAREFTLEEFLGELRSLGDESLKLIELERELLELNVRATAKKREIVVSCVSLRSTLPTLNCSDHLRSEIASCIESYEKPVVEVKEVLVSYSEENSFRPLVIVSKPDDEHEYEIDVVESLQKTSTNYSNPWVQAAIIRYARAAAGVVEGAPSLSKQTALQCLAKVNKALIAGCKADEEIDWAYNALYLSRPSSDEWYLSVVFDVWSCDDVKNARAKSAKLRIIREQLLKRVPGENPDQIHSFIEAVLSHDTRIRGRSFANVADLRNAYEVYQTQKALSTVKSRRTRARKIVERSMQEQMQQLNRNATIDLLASSFLVWRERPKGNKHIR